MNPKALKYILDIESIISELEILKDKVGNNYNNFQKEILIKRAAERDLEIIGEAINKLLQIDPSINISNTKNIIGLRNLIVHAYDSIEDEIIWGIIQKDIPILKTEIEKLKK